MKRILLATAAVLAGLATATAADLKNPAYKAPEPAPLGCYFCGFYIGGHGGYGWDIGGGSALIGATPVDFNAAPQGFVGGLHLGYGYQFGGPLYLGLEGDGSIATLDGTTNNPGFIGSISAKDRWLASVRARFGVVVDRTLIYGTAGWGWGSADFTATALTDVGTISQSLTANLSGVAFGAGLEYALAPNWLVRAEFLRYDFNNINAPMLGIPATAQSRVDVARGGISYKF